MANKAKDHILLTSAALGAVAGMRSMAAPALLTHELSEHAAGLGHGRLDNLLTSEGVARVFTVLAGGEILADKSPFVPDRTAPLPLIARAVIGSLTAAAFAVHRRRAVLLPAAVGAASAIASTFAAYHARRLAAEHLKVPDRLLGLVEDAIVVAASKAIVAAMEVE